LARHLLHGGSNVCTRHSATMIPAAPTVPRRTRAPRACGAGHAAILRIAAAAAMALALPPAPAAAEPVLARYEVRAAGLTVMRVTAGIDIDAQRYRISTRVEIAGLADLFASGDQVTAAEGVWQAADPAPRHYRVSGTWRGGPRRVEIDWGTDGRPQVGTLVPPAEAEREPVPEPLRLRTMDALSALAKLVRTVAETGACDLTAAVFDGRRRADYTARTEGIERLPEAEVATGRALRCGFESRLLAGRRGDQDPEAAQRPQPGTAWLAQLRPGLPPLPVRVELPSRWFGTIRVLLVALEPLPAGVPAPQ
jgi:hypothetical protein